MREDIVAKSNSLKGSHNSTDTLLSQLHTDIRMWLLGPSMSMTHILSVSPSAHHNEHALKNM